MRDLTLAPARAGLHRTARDDRGAIGIVVAVLLGSGALFGMGALVVDTGQLYQNRAEVQNGADAAALAVAKSCADGACAADAATRYATANSRSGRASVSLVCGSGSLGSCPASTGLPTDCPAAPAAGTNYADVHASAQTTPAFAGALTGGGTQGSTVQACARVQWGPALQSHSLAITISLCVWNALTGGSPFGTGVAIPVKGSAAPCSGPAGQSVPGGFGWLAADSSCNASIDLTASTASSDPGSNVPSACKAVLPADVAARTVVYLPVFDSTGGSGAGASYHLAGLAAFILNGYENLPGLHPDVVPGAMSGECGKNVPCLFGYFTQSVAPLTDVIGSGTNFGATAIKLAG